MAKIEYGYVSLKDFEQVIDVIPPRDELYAVAFSLMRYRGLRPCSVVVIRLWDILEGRKLLVHNTKRGRQSVMELPEIAWQRLSKYVEGNKHRFLNGYLFTGLTSKYEHMCPTTLSKKWRFYFRKAGLTCDFEIDTRKKIANAGRKLWCIRFYDLRASFGTDIQLANRDIYTTSVMLDHADTRTAHVYLRKAILVNQAEVLNAVFATANYKGKTP